MLEFIPLFKSLWNLISRLPDLSGPWDFTVTYENTAYNPYRGLHVTYRALLLQNGDKLSGNGEKTAEGGPTQSSREYTGAQRVHIKINGTVSREYFTGRLSKVRVKILYREFGDERPSSTSMNLTVCDRETMAGCFSSTIADTSGPVIWRRLKATK